MSVTLETDEPESIPGVDSEGRPDPAYAEQLGLVPAPPLRRSLAFLIDAVIGAVLLLPAALSAIPFFARFIGEAVTPMAVFGQPDWLLVVILTSASWLLYSIYIVVQLGLHGRKGYTFGKRILGIRSVNVARFDKPGFWRMVGRAAVLAAANALVPLVGALVLLCSASWRPRGLSWLDSIGSNWMIDVKNGLDPFDAKALRHARRAVDAEPETEATRLPSLSTGSSDNAPFLPATRSRAGVVGAPPTVPTPPAPGYPISRGIEDTPLQPLLSARLMFDDGTVHEVRGRGILGRDPSPRQAVRVDTVLAVVDDSRSLSKTHIDFAVVPGGLSVTDRTSTNGTAIRTPDGTVTPLAPGVASLAAWNDSVQLGERWFRVTSADTSRRE